MAQSLNASQVLETCIYAVDLESAEIFYSNVLGLVPFAKVEGRHVFFRCGETVFLVFNPEATRTEDPNLGVPTHGAVGPGHVCFTMKKDEIENWKARLVENGVPLEREHTWPTGGYSIYFRDPAANSVELATRKTWNLTD